MSGNRSGWIRDSDADERGYFAWIGSFGSGAAGAENLPEFETKNGWVQFEKPPGTAPLTNERLEEWERADYDDGSLALCEFVADRTRVRLAGSRG